MDKYIELVKTYPILTAMVQFAILGTFGDIISKWIVERKISKPFTIKVMLLKALEWAFLAILIKYAFVGFKGFVKLLVAEQYLPELGNFTRAFAISTTMNLQFGLLLVLMHRLLDNLIARQSNWNNIDKGFYSLLWFWIPAHTVTFMLPKHFQIGLAALWSVMLGIILGFYQRKPQK
ncbi:MAG: hypothetical protein ACQETH_04000 [Candidatus Rifleibacteriota bacterium]